MREDGTPTESVTDSAVLSGCYPASVISVRSWFPALAGLALLASTAACSGDETTPSAAPAKATTTVTTTLPAPTTSGALPADADARGWSHSFARCAGNGERPVLLIAALTDSTERYAVCERSGADRVLRVAAPRLRAQPFEARFFTFTANSQQFVAEDGTKIDLAREVVTVIDDPQAKRGLVVSYVVQQYWSSF